eukprot:2800675-Lingulodinium_polyedra.AAC.1
MRRDITCSATRLHYHFYAAWLRSIITAERVLAKDKPQGFWHAGVYERLCDATQDRLPNDSPPQTTN